jgi:predicted metal-dependent phosphoesterase TrpH
MIASLKADLHVHTYEGELAVRYTAREVIAHAAREGYRVFSITNHDLQTYSDDLAAYARDLGVLLIPGVEATVEGRHVLVYNADVGVDKLQTFADLRRYRTPEWLVVAAHPFFPMSYCLRERLWTEIELFDAIEFSHFYTTRVDFNRAAVKLAGAVGLPMLGTSDSHLEEQLGTTFSLIEAELTIESVLSAIRKGRVGIVSRPLSLVRCARIFGRVTLATLVAGARVTPDRTPAVRPGRSPRAAASVRR